MCNKIIFLTLAIIAGVSAEAKPEAKPAVVAPLAYTAEVVVDAPVVATSSQFIARNYNGFAAPLVTAPIAYTASAYSPYYASPYAYAVNPVAPVKSVVAAPIKYTSAAVLV
ncbi:hypothetical protein Bhyg_06858 [Pseudolycoriella hygida]|uniref:Uncharacterized protein n=1 Tax=Pseudolycoriella hygida TaxID=35572 RepID=A0A9Q0N1I1_9DIPT|nr:hypothetical protein Bhyg_06858 [Pseudolycoriella hygida]